MNTRYDISSTGLNDKQCYVCNKKFGVLGVNGKHKCHRCNHQICCNCSSQKRYDSSTHEMVRVCDKCLQSEHCIVINHRYCLRNLKLKCNKRNGGTYIVSPTSKIYNKGLINKCRIIAINEENVETLNAQLIADKLNTIKIPFSITLDYTEAERQPFNNKQCYVCYKQFGVPEMHRKHICHGCNHNICCNCSTQKRYNFKTDEMVRVCDKCLQFEHCIVITHRLRNLKLKHYRRNGGTYIVRSSQTSEEYNEGLINKCKIIEINEENVETLKSELIADKLNTIKIPFSMTLDYRKAEMKPFEEEYISFPISHLSKKLMSGYIGREKQLKTDIPNDIQTIIIKYYNLLFVRIRYNIDNDERYGDLMVFDKNLMFGSIIKMLQKKEIMSWCCCKKNEQNYIRLWMRFFAIKSIYTLPVEKKKLAINIEIDDIDKVNKNNYRWVELPDDYTITTMKINDVISSIQNSDDPDYILEILVETFDQSNNIWPFQTKNGGYKERKEWRENLEIGDIIHVKDQHNKWHESFIRHIEIDKHSRKTKMIFVHHIGRNIKWDEKLHVNHVNRIKKRNANTTALYGARNKIKKLKLLFGDGQT